MDQSSEPNPSPIEAVTQTRLLGHTFPRERIISVGVVITEVLQNNPNRLDWIAINEGANDVRVANEPNISASSGWLLAANGGIISFQWEEDGESVSYPVYMIASGVASNVRIREILRS